jgi:hypothetical protein
MHLVLESFQTRHVRSPQRVRLGWHTRCDTSRSHLPKRKQTGRMNSSRHARLHVPQLRFKIRCLVLHSRPSTSCPQRRPVYPIPVPSQCTQANLWGHQAGATHNPPLTDFESSSSTIPTVTIIHSFPTSRVKWSRPRAGPAWCVCVAGVVVGLWGAPGGKIPRARFYSYMLHHLLRVGPSPLR